MSNDNNVICPGCAYEFFAIPVNVQEELIHLRDAQSEGMFMPYELVARIEDSLGSFVSDHGWDDADMDVMDSVAALRVRTLRGK